MRKTMALLAILLISATVKAEDLIKASLLDNVATVTMFKNGETNLAMMDSVLMFGDFGGKSIFDLEAGFSGETRPEPGEPTSASLLVGGFFKVSTFLNTKAHFPEHWEFLRSLEHGVVYVYDFREKRDYVAYQVGLAFDLNPK